jgi:hypothetical protein
MRWLNTSHGWAWRASTHTVLDVGKSRTRRIARTTRTVKTSAGNVRDIVTSQVDIPGLCAHGGAAIILTLGWHAGLVCTHYQVCSKPFPELQLLPRRELAPQSRRCHVREINSIGNRGSRNGVCNALPLLLCQPFKQVSTSSSSTSTSLGPLRCMALT